MKKKECDTFVAMSRHELKREMSLFINKHVKVYAKQMDADFTVMSDQGMTPGSKGDWLVQYDDGRMFPMPDKYFHEKYQQFEQE